MNKNLFKVAKNWKLGEVTNELVSAGRIWELNHYGAETFLTASDSDIKRDFRRFITDKTKYNGKCYSIGIRTDAKNYVTMTFAAIIPIGGAGSHEEFVREYKSLREYFRKNPVQTIEHGEQDSNGNFTAKTTKIERTINKPVLVRNVL